MKAFVAGIIGCERRRDNFTQTHALRDGKLFAGLVIWVAINGLASCSPFYWSIYA